MLKPASYSPTGEVAPTFLPMQTQPKPSTLKFRAEGLGLLTTEG